MKKQLKNEKNLPVGARDLSRAPNRRQSGHRNDVALVDGVFYAGGAVLRR